MGQDEARPKLGDILIKLLLIDEEQVELALEHQGKSGKLFGESLLELGFVGEDDLSWALSSQLGLPFVAATPEMADADLLERYPTNFLRKNLVLPLVASDTSLSVVLADPTDKTTLTRLERISGLELEVAVGTPGAIKRALDSVLAESDETPEEPSLEFESKDPPSSLSSPQLTQLLDRALTQGAVAVYLDPEGDQVQVRFRDSRGRLTDSGTFEPEALRELVSALNTWLGTGKEPVPGVRVWDYGPRTHPLPFRAMTVSGSDGPSLTLVMDESLAAGRHALEAPHPEDWSRIHELISRPYGLIVGVAGTREGQEQTLARLLDPLETANRRVCALIAEEVPLPRGIIRVAGDPTPATTRAFCHLDGVDVLTGIFENSECLRRLAEAGGRDRLVIAAFPGNGALGFLARMLEAGVSSSLLSESLLAVVAERSVPGESPDGPPRIVAETLFADRPLRRALQNGGHIEELRRAATEQGFEEIALRARALDAIDETTMKDLERHRYLEDAA